MTERAGRHVARTADTYRIGPSAVHVDGDEIVFRIDEIGFPLPRRLRGTIRLKAGAISHGSFALDPAGRHVWRPVSAHGARILVDLDHPRLSFEGTGYADMNAGSEPLEAGFRSWDWFRRTVGEETRLVYDSRLKAGGEALLSLAVGSDGLCRPVPAADRQTLPRSLWGIGGTMRSHLQPSRQSVRVVEDTPFYRRSMIRPDGEGGHGMHEHADLLRFAHPVVQAMLPFRMPRRA
jgi:carotenoid 1,2-hydratase